MKKKMLNRINLLLGTVIFSLLGLNSCERMVKYGAPPDPPEERDTLPDNIVPLYGVQTPVLEDVTADNPLSEE